MVRYHADWVVPVSGPPIRDGWVAVEHDRVVAVGGVGGHRPLQTRGEVVERDLGAVAILPGLVNAHTHLELSYLRGEVPPCSSFIAWIRHVVGRRRAHQNPASPPIMAAVEAAIQEAVACGTALVGDITNTLVTAGPLAGSVLGGVVFYEIIRFNGRDAEAFVEQAATQIDTLPVSETIKVGLAAHAPYSVGPLVFRAIRQHLDRRPAGPTSVHLSESAEEVEFIRDGTGPWRGFLEEIGVWDESWLAPGVSPVRYLDEHGFLSPRLLVVHGVQMTADDLARVTRSGATLVTCPRSNRCTGAGDPPVADFYASGARVAVGTDSLASTPDLNVFAELAALRALAPAVPASTLLESATLQGARALGFDANFGTIEPGKCARLLAVDVPPGTTDVEEYLVSGLEPRQVTWLDAIED